MDSSLTIDRLPELVGHELAPCDWVEISREMIAAFAGCTGDHQYIHLDAERVKRETDYPDVLAHGFLLLSLVNGPRPPDFPQVRDAALILNYGIDRLRFTSPVFAGQRVRYRVRITGAEPRGAGRMLLKREVTLEVEGREQPALVATLLGLYVQR